MHEGFAKKAMSVALALSLCAAFVPASALAAFDDADALRGVLGSASVHETSQEGEVEQPEEAAESEQPEETDGLVQPADSDEVDDPADFGEPIVQPDEDTPESVEDVVVASDSAEAEDVAQAPERATALASLGAAIKSTLPTALAKDPVNVVNETDLEADRLGVDQADTSSTSSMTALAVSPYNIKATWTATNAVVINSHNVTGKFSPGNTITLDATNNGSKGIYVYCRFYMDGKSTTNTMLSPSGIPLNPNISSNFTITFPDAAGTGWVDKVDTDTINGYACVAIYMLSTAPSRKITFNLNDGSGKTKTYTGQQGTAVALSTAYPDAPTRTDANGRDYTFAGWSFKTNGSGTPFYAYDGSSYKSKFTPAGKDETLYAAWARTATLTASAHGSATPKTAPFYYDSSGIGNYNRSSTTKRSVAVDLQPTGEWTAEGWTKDEAGTTKQYDASFTLNDSDLDDASVTLYGLESRQVSIAYDANGADAETSEVPETLKETQVYNESGQATTTPSIALAARPDGLAKEGYSFGGWDIDGATYEAGDSSYTWSNDTDDAAVTAKAIWNLTPVVTAPTPDGELVYDGKAQTLAEAGSTNMGDMEYGLAQAGPYSATPPSAIDAGDYAIWYRVVNADGDVVWGPQRAAETAKIKPYRVTVTAIPQSKRFGDADPDLTYDTSGLIGDDGFEGSLAREEGEDVGPYAITQGTLTAGDNYDIAFTGADLTIYKGDSEVVTPPTASGNLTYSGAPQALVTAGTARNGAMRYRLGTTGEWAAKPPTATVAGRYDVYYMAVGDPSSNYRDTDVLGPVACVISPAPLTVTADDASISYGDAVPAFHVTYSGFVGEEGPGDLSGELAYTCAYDRYDGVGTYDIVPSGLESDNYDITFAKGTLLVNKATWTATAASGEARYGGSGTVDLSGLVAPGGAAGALSVSDPDGVLASAPVLGGALMTASVSNGDRTDCSLAAAADPGSLTLSYSLADDASKAGKSATVTVPVTAPGYEGYEIAVTLTALGDPDGPDDSGDGTGDDSGSGSGSGSGDGSGGDSGNGSGGGSGGDPGNGAGNASGDDPGAGSGNSSAGGSDGGSDAGSGDGASASGRDGAGAQGENAGGSAGSDGGKAGKRGGAPSTGDALPVALLGAAAAAALAVALLARPKRRGKHAR